MIVNFEDRVHFSSFNESDMFQVSFTLHSKLFYESKLHCQNIRKTVCKQFLYIYLNTYTGYENGSKFIVPQNYNYFTRQS